MTLESVRFRPHWKPDDESQVLGLVRLVAEVTHENPSASRWLELGCYGGESAQLVLAATNQITLLHAVDQWGEAVEATSRRLAREIVGGRAMVFRSSTADFARQAVGDGRRYDVVYIDADHTYEGARADIEAFVPLIAFGGHLCGHDYHDRLPGVRQAVDEFAARLGVVPRIYQDSSWAVRL